MLGLGCIVQKRYTGHPLPLYHTLLLSPCPYLCLPRFLLYSTYVCLSFYSTLLHINVPCVIMALPMTTYVSLCLYDYMALPCPQKGHRGISSLRGMKIVILQQPPTRANKWNSFTRSYFNVFIHTRIRTSSST